MRRLFVIRRSDCLPSGEYRSYVYLEDGTIVAAVDDSEYNCKLLELGGYEGLFRIDDYNNVSPRIPHPRYVYYNL